MVWLTSLEPFWALIPVHTSLWVIDYKATLEFMRSFYQKLLEGRRVTESPNQAMECLREPHNYGDVKYWDPLFI